MAISPNHVTIVVREIAPARAFFALFGFEELETKFISGKVMEDYMGVPGIEAEHVTLVLKGFTPHFDIQLLRYIKPEPKENPNVRDLTATGYNHLCFSVDDLDGLMERLAAAGVRSRNDGMEFRDYKMAFVWGPENITLELVQRLA